MELERILMIFCIIVVVIIGLYMIERNSKRMDNEIIKHGAYRIKIEYPELTDSEALSFAKFVYEKTNEDFGL